MSRLQKKYKQEIIVSLQKKYKNRNIMTLPKLEKIVINMGIAEVSKDKAAILEHIKELSLLSGQKPIVMKAKKSISNFKLREGQSVGLKVTLRKKRMCDFLDRFCNIVCPRIRDFRGFKIKFDGHGNMNIGLNDQKAFPEINLDAVKREQGMNIAFVTSATKDEECRELFELLGFPFADAS